MSTTINFCGVILLAAGQSSRLGQPKQLLTYDGDSLIRRAVQVALDAAAGPVIVVLGAHAEQIRPVIHLSGIQIVENTQWETGMASSVHAGLEFLVQQHPEADGALLMVCDQPHLEPSILQRLVQLQQQAGSPAVCCTYGGSQGTPALFHRSLFPSLLQLKGDAGARKLLQHLGNTVTQLTFEKGLLDIDTPDDYADLLKRNNQTS
jgi:molybdenum cofactor cytidylyltransferase